MIAKELAGLYTRSSKPVAALSKRPLVIGGTVVDICAKIDTAENYMHTSNPGKVTQTLGGVGRNIAEACSRTGGNPHFLSVVGNTHVLKQLDPIDSSFVKVSKSNKSSSYVAIFDKRGELVASVADTELIQEINRNDACAALI